MLGIEFTVGLYSRLTAGWTPRSGALEGVGGALPHPPVDRPGRDWSSFFRTRTIDYKGDEVKTAQQFAWKNIKPAIPREIGVVELKDICEQGCKHYIEHFPDFLKPPHEWEQVRKAKVMVTDRDWSEVAAGLLEAGIFGVIPESEVFRAHGK